MLSKRRLISTLPVRRADLTIREWTRHDVDLLSAWPRYPFPYEVFQFSFTTMNPTERDEAFKARRETTDQLCLVVDHAGRRAIGYIALMRLDWAERTIGNVGFRIHPFWCSRGLGTAALRAVTRWSFERGIRSWCLDVAASNARAIRCYTKVGFAPIGEIWREARELSDVDLNESRYDFVRPHVRKTEGSIELRFVLMELEAGGWRRSEPSHAGDADKPSR